MVCCKDQMWWCKWAFFFNSEKIILFIQLEKPLSTLTCKTIRNVVKCLSTECSWTFIEDSGSLICWYWNKHYSLLKQTIIKLLHLKKKTFKTPSGSWAPFFFTAIWLHFQRKFWGLQIWSWGRLRNRLQRLQTGVFEWHQGLLCLASPSLYCFTQLPFSIFDTQTSLSQELSSTFWKISWSILENSQDLAWVSS